MNSHSFFKWSAAFFLEIYIIFENGEEAVMIKNMFRKLGGIYPSLVCALTLNPVWAFASESGALAPVAVESETAWWVWPVVLLVVTFVMGIIAVLGGVGGGVLYVPIISGFFPFHLDFVRGTGLLVALSGALAAGPGLLKMNMASLRLAIPVALIASTMAIVGAMVGLALPTNVVQILLGATILGIVVIMFTAKKSAIPDVKQADALSSALRITGIYHEASSGQDINWKVHRTHLGLATFIIIGFMAGMFGLGAGWANVPVLNLMMGAPLKIIPSTRLAWQYSS